MDLGFFIGLAIALFGIIGGYYLEGGMVLTLIQAAGALIVFSGTFGATLIANSFEDVCTGFVLFLKTFKHMGKSYKAAIGEQIVESSRLARRKSILAIENNIEEFPNKFMQDVFRSMVDGMDGENLKSVFESEIESDEEKKIAGARVWSDAGGYAPTIGIIGAVLGLIHVMSDLSDTTNLGKGIAVAFVATLYGIGSANLIFLPISNKIQSRIRKEVEIKKMILKGAVGILSGLSPYMVHETVKSFIDVSDV